MSKVRTFSRCFPKGHPKEGQPTFFVEKIWLWLVNEDGYSEPQHHKEYKELVNIMDVLKQDHTKRHTIRGGKHFKAGDYFSPRVWSDKPYSSKQKIIAGDIKLEKVFDIKIEIDKDYICVLIDDYPFYEENKTMVTQVEALETLANNDGLSLPDFKSWFKWGKQPFDGQILCWAKGVEY